MPAREPFKQNAFDRRQTLGEEQGSGSTGGATIIDSVLVDNVTIDKRSSDSALEVKDGGITSDKIDPAFLRTVGIYYLADYVLDHAATGTGGDNWPTWSGSAGETRIALVVNDPTSSKNGLWTITLGSSSSTAARTVLPIVYGSLVLAVASTPFGGGTSWWYQDNAATITVGTTAQSWICLNALTYLTGTIGSDIANKFFRGLRLFSTDGSIVATPALTTVGSQKYPGFDLSATLPSGMPMVQQDFSASGTIADTTTIASVVACPPPGITVTMPDTTTYPPLTQLIVKDESGQLTSSPPPGQSLTLTCTGLDIFQSGATSIGPITTIYFTRCFYHRGTGIWYQLY